MYTLQGMSIYIFLLEKKDGWQINAKVKFWGAPICHSSIIIIKWFS
jgi:hypothetical protein